MMQKHRKGGSVHPFRAALMDHARRRYEDRWITLGEYRERLHAYVDAETPPEKIHRDEFLPLDDVVYHGGSWSLFGETYTIDGEWFHQVE